MWSFIGHLGHASDLHFVHYVHAGITPWTHCKSWTSSTWKKFNKHRKYRVRKKFTSESSSEFDRFCVSSKDESDRAVHSSPFTAAPLSASADPALGLAEQSAVGSPAIHQSNVALLSHFRTGHLVWIGVV